MSAVNVIYFHYVTIISSYEQKGVLLLNKTQGCFVPSLIEMGPVNLENFFLVEFHHVAIISPLKRTHGPSFEQTWIPITQRCLVPSLVEIGPLLLEEKTRNVKSLQRQLTTDKIRLCMTVEMKHQQK